MTKMITRIIVVCTLLIGISNVLAETEVEFVGKIWDKCKSDKIRAIDDMRSDASSIAKAVLYACKDALDAGIHYLCKYNIQLSEDAEKNVRKICLRGIWKMEEKPA
jgi:hypothetical protein